MAFPRNLFLLLFSEAAVRRFSSKQALLEILQNAQENIYVESLFNKIAGRLATLFQPRPKRDLNTGDSSENSKIFTSSFFYGTPPVAAFVSLIT